MLQQHPAFILLILTLDDSSTIQMVLREDYGKNIPSPFDLCVWGSTISSLHFSLKSDLEASYLETWPLVLAFSWFFGETKNKVTELSYTGTGSHENLQLAVNGSFSRACNLMYRLVNVSLLDFQSWGGILFLLGKIPPNLKMPNCSSVLSLEQSSYYISILSYSPSEKDGIFNIFTVSSIMYRFMLIYW